MINYLLVNLNLKKIKFLYKMCVKYNSVIK